MAGFGKNYTNIKLFFSIWQFFLEIAGFYENFAIFNYFKTYNGNFSPKIAIYVKLSIVLYNF